MCPGGTEALQTAAKDCTPCRPGNSHHANLKLQDPKKVMFTSTAAHSRKRGSVTIHPGDIWFLNRHAQAPPSGYVSNLRQWLLPDPLGPGKLWCVPRESLLPCEHCTSHTLSNKRKWTCVCVSWISLVTQHVVVSESRREPHSVPQRCILSGGQLGSRLLHGDFLS